jgi:23S rRNA (guanosine2251-2'-O)-methyltransferase
LFHSPLCRVSNAARAIEIFQNSGIAMVGCTEKTEVFIEAVDMKGPTCIIMGSEDTGISNDFIRKADSLGKIHMEGKTSSLNVSVAAGIIMYELNRQRRIK